MSIFPRSIALLVALAAIGCDSAKPTRSDQAKNIDLPEQETPKAPPTAQPAVQEIEAGVFFQEVSIKRPSGPMRVWLYSPTRNVTQPVGCVVVPPAERFFAAMTNRNRASKRVLVESGGHYDSMIREGIPKAIAWFDGLTQTAGGK